MIYEEFSALKQIKDNHNPFSTLYELEDGSRFYIEPVFYTHLRGFKERIPHQQYLLIINRIIEVAKKNKKVIYTGNFEFPQTDVDEDFIILEITDITDPLQIYVEDKSRGSDYGD